MGLEGIDLNHLYTFRLVVELGGVLPAARRLGRTQPAISVRLRNLEEDLGLKLFERAGRRLVLTHAGRDIDREARHILGGVQRLADRVRATAADAAGVLRLGTLPTVSAYLLPPHLARYLAAHPGADVEVRHGLTETQLVDLRDGKLDVVVTIGPLPRGTRLHVRRIGQVAPLLAAREGALKGRVTPARLRALPYLGFGKTGDPFFDGVWAYLARHRVTARLHVGHIQSLKQLVLAGAGVSVVPGYTIVEPGLVGLPVEGLAFTLPIWAATRKSSVGIPLVARFLDGLEHVLS